MTAKMDLDQLVAQLGQLTREELVRVAVDFTNLYEGRAEVMRQAITAQRTVRDSAAVTE